MYIIDKDYYLVSPYKFNWFSNDYNVEYVYITNLRDMSTELVSYDSIDSCDFIKSLETKYSFLKVNYFHGTNLREDEYTCKFYLSEESNGFSTAFLDVVNNSFLEYQEGDNIQLTASIDGVNQFILSTKDSRKSINSSLIVQMHNSRYCLHISGDIGNIRDSLTFSLNGNLIFQITDFGLLGAEFLPMYTDNEDNCIVTSLSLVSFSGNCFLELRFYTDRLVYNLYDSVLKDDCTKNNSIVITESDMDLSPEIVSESLEVLALKMKLAGF